MIQIQSVEKRYGEHRALQGLTLEVGAGEIYGLLGPNGAGKTTTIHLVAGLLKPDAGTLKVAGVEAGDDPARLRAALAYVPESVSLYPHLSGLENLDHFSRLAGRRLDASELASTLERMGLPAEAARRRVGTYSKGMRQKVGLAIAMAKDAKGLLLDEPSSGLDPSASFELAERTREVAAAGMAVLMATHDLFRARETCTRIGLLSGGRLVKEWRAEEVTASDLESAYLSHVRGAKERK